MKHLTKHLTKTLAKRPLTPVKGRLMDGLQGERSRCSHPEPPCSPRGARLLWQLPRGLCLPPVPSGDPWVSPEIPNIYL